MTGIFKHQRAHGHTNTHKQTQLDWSHYVKWNWNEWTNNKYNKVTVYVWTGERLCVFFLNKRRRIKRVCHVLLELYSLLDLIVWWMPYRKLDSAIPSSSIIIIIIMKKEERPVVSFFFFSCSPVCITHSIWSWKRSHIVTFQLIDRCFIIINTHSII